MISATPLLSDDDVIAIGAVTELGGGDMLRTVQAKEVRPVVQLVPGDRELLFIHLRDGL